MNYFKLLLLLIFFSINPATAYDDDSFMTMFKSHSAVMLLIAPEDGRIVAANDAAVAFYGYEHSDFLALTIQDINTLNAQQVAYERKMAREENRNFFIFQHKLANGNIKTVEVYSVQIMLRGQALLFSIIHDITNTRSLENELWHYQTNLEQLVQQQITEIEASELQLNSLLVVCIILLILLSIYFYYLLHKKQLLEEQNYKLSQIVEQSSVAIMTTDPEGFITYVNKKFKQSTGYNFSDVRNRKPSILKAAKLNDELYKDLWQSISQGETWTGEFYNKRKNGEHFWERANIYSLKNSNNEIDSYVAIKEDISQQKENEKQLRLASTVFQTATEGVMVTDSNNVILAVNDAFSKITGFSQQESLGKTPAIFNSGHHDEAFYQKMMAELEQHDEWQGEICNRRKNGEVYYEWLSITALRDSRGNLEAYVSLFSDITKRKHAEDKIYHQANFDSLTGLANRNLFIDRFNQVITMADRRRHQVALFFIDLDGFKNVNDTLGHSKGDMLLQLAAKRITQSLRKSDTVCRLGGDEFAIILLANDDVYTVERVAAKIQYILAKPFYLDDNKAFVSASIGIAIYPEDGTDSEMLLQKADNAMYKAKQSGRNNFQFFTKEMDVKAQRRRSLELELRQAINHQQFVLLYQPIHEINSGKIFTAEALIRWVHPESGIISPAEFIPLAEELGLINEIGEWVLKQACKQAKQWCDTEKNSPKISVNVSSLQFRQNDMPKLVSQVLVNSQLPPEQLILEITESLLVADDKDTLQQLNEIKAMGVSLSIDDFGTGYSSLSYLKRFPIDKLKIDRAFITDVTSNSEDDALVSAIISMAHSLNLTVVAEGVETRDQLALLAEKHCEYIQGYIYSRPLEANEFVAYMDSNVVVE